MTIKCTMLFQITTKVSEPGYPIHRVAGWSESWYFPGTNIQSAIQALIGGPALPFNVFASGLAVARAGLLPTGAAIVGLRFQTVSPIGPSQVLPVSLPGSGAEADSPFQAILCSVNGIGVRNIRRFMLRGIADSLVTEGEFTPNSVWNQYFNAFGASLAGFQFQGRDLSQVQSPVISITAIGLLTAAPNLGGIASQTYVRVLKSRDSGGNLRGGRFYVATIGPNANQINIPNWPYGNTTGGNVRLDPGPVYPSVDSTTFKPVRITERKVGRPFVAFRGRRSRRR